MAQSLRQHEYNTLLVWREERTITTKQQVMEGNKMADPTDKLRILELENSLDVVFAYIVQLENESFEGWSEDSRNGYMTATKSIKEKVRQQFI